jgi:hypothetical protein
MYSGWQRDATIDPAQITRYWRAEPGPNIGVVCGEAFDAFDIESTHLEALRAWMEHDRRRLPRTPLARTGRGGIHILVAPTGIGGSRDLRLDGVHVGELKSMGGFIVVCPSLTAGRYRWLRTPDEVGLAAAPDWLTALARRTQVVRRVPSGGDPRPARRGLDALARAIATAGVGRRNKVLYWAMRRAEEEGVPTREAASALGRTALEAGLDEREVRCTIRSAHQGSRR